MQETFDRIGEVKTSTALNLENAEGGVYQTVAIVGLPRGGTSMVAAVVHALGIDLGPPEDIDAFHFEDQKMQSAHIEVRHEHITLRNKDNNVWGWKDPVGVTRIQDTAPLLRNLYVILVSRDPIATVQGEIRFDKVHLSGSERPLKDVLRQTCRWWKRNFEFLQETDLPTLIVSYERAINDPERFVEEVCEFLGVEASPETKKEAVAKIAPGGGYLVTSLAPTTKILMQDICWRYINLDSREDRRRHMEKQMRRAGIVATRFAALTKEEYDGPSEKVAEMQSTPNTIGNWLSHTSLMAEARDTGEIIGVLEDDALLCQDFQERICYLGGHFDKPWDIFFLGATFHDDIGGKWHPELGRDFELTEICHVVRVYGAFSNQGYLVNPRSADKVIWMMNQVMHKSTGSDHALIQIQPKLNCYCFIPGMVFQIDGPSDIGEGVTKFSNFLKMGQYVWTDTLSEFDYAAWNTKHGTHQP